MNIVIWHSGPIGQIWCICWNLAFIMVTRHCQFTTVVTTVQLYRLYHRFMCRPVQAGLFLLYRSLQTHLKWVLVMLYMATSHHATVNMTVDFDNEEAYYSNLLPLKAHLTRMQLAHYTSSIWTNLAGRASSSHHLSLEGYNFENGTPLCSNSHQVI